MGCGCEDSNSRNGQDGVGIANIADLGNNSFRITLTDNTYYTVVITPPKGDKGDTGNTGAAGATGAIGPVGPPATNGKDGKDGTDGVNGRSVFSGNGVPPSILGETNDHYINLLNFDFYKKDGTWQIAGNIKGGDGEDGEDGNRIDTSDTLATAIDGLNNNDLLITLDNYNLYQWESIDWALIGNIRGQEGPRGRSQVVYIQPTEPTGGSYFDGDLWIIDGSVVSPPVPDPPVANYSVALGFNAVVAPMYNTIPPNNGIAAFAIDVPLPNDLVLVARIKFLNLEGEEQTIKVTGNIIAGTTSIGVPFNTGDDGGVNGEAPFTANGLTSSCIESFYSLANVQIANYGTYECQI